MADKENVLKHWLEELKRRKVFRIAVAYMIGAWILMQVADVTFAPLNLPPWSTSLVLWLLILGFPVAVGLAWSLEVTPQGVRRTKPRSRASTGRPADHTGPRPSIAVLPFADMSPDKDQDPFCEGMAEEISTR